MSSALRRRPLPGCGYAAVAKGIGHVCHLVGSPPVRRRRASRHGCWIGGGVVAAACLGAAAWVAPPFLGLMNQVKGFEQMTVPGAVTVHVPRPGIRVLYVEGPRTAGRAGKAVAWSQGAATGDYRISAGPGTSARRMVANGGEALWVVVSHIASSAVVFLARAGAGAR